MPSPTTEHHTSPPQQTPTRNVAQQGTQPAPAVVPRPDPVLFDDLDPVLLVRLYPEEMQTTTARAKALAQGKKTQAEGDKLVAAQQEPVLLPAA